MVVKEPRNPIIKKKYIGDDLLAIKPATHPITKQPNTFTESVPTVSYTHLTLPTIYSV